MAAAVLDDRGRVLAIRRRDNGRWEPPGGVLELHESITDGLVREVFEETGLRVESEALTGVYKNVVLGIVALVFRCRLVSGLAAATIEAQEVAWLTPDQLRERMAEAYAVRMLDALEPGLPQVRSHDGQVLLTSVHK